MRLSEFDYELPPERIAQQPPEERDAARMLVLHRADGRLEDRRFRELPELLAPGDLLVANDSRVFPARLLGQRASGGKVEVLLLEPQGGVEWTALVHPGARLDVGARLSFDEGLEAEIVARGTRGERRLRFSGVEHLSAWLETHGHVPLPPYIRRPDEAMDRERYQTIYAHEAGSAAAPTAGLHFTPRVQAVLLERGIRWTAVSLHVGLGTFQPVVSEEIEQHPMHTERFSVSESAAAALNRARAESKRIVAIGTTAARVLETIAPEPGAAFRAQSGATGIYIYPGGRPFRAVDALLTNFHAPRTTLLMMIAAFAGMEPVRAAYQHALAGGYRFLSYGDCMLML
ncbi:MAG: tRNA preQ1(34) S-adenosylmethionine ribosyltransferase-isomerase QueA [Acidobacteria bacterium]|nr:MAG: tRNA preQ1(34) S-adenosylmethionine ribosyltransferase-isomerase QueA [Acidobacteriota bacterium]